MTTTDITYEPVYTPSQQGRLDKLRGNARWIFQEVLQAMQNADELGGPEGDAYVKLMDVIIHEAAEPPLQSLSLLPLPHCASGWRRRVSARQTCRLSLRRRQL